jgi:parallel beta-helix repeat protein
MDELVAHSSGAVTGSSPNFVVHESITISKEDTLIINPGEIIKFDLNCALSVNGILKAIGTDDNNITFTSNEENPEQGDWQGIRFHDDSIDHECIIEYCIVEYAKTGVHCDRSSPTIVNNIIRKNSHPINGGTSEGNIVCDYYASPNISNNTIELSDNFGILIKHDSKPNILDNEILNNEHGGILCSRGADAFISRNDVSDNGYGFEIFLSDPIITFNTLYYNVFDAFYGATSCNSTLSNNIIENSNVFDIHLRKNSNVILLNTEFDDGNVMIEDDTSSLTVKWNIDIKVADKNDAPIVDARVKIYDPQNIEIYSGLTDSNGYVRNIVCVEYVKTSTTTVRSKIEVTKDGYIKAEQQVIVDETKEISVELLLPGQADGSDGLSETIILIIIGVGIAVAVLLGIFIGLKRPRVDDEIKEKRAKKTRKGKPEKQEIYKKPKKKVKGKRYPTKKSSRKSRSRR